MYDKGNGPTARIIQRALSAPGGLIRWREAEAEYVSSSEAARRHARRGENNHHIWLKAIFDRHFVKVEGVDGHYVLRNYTLPGYPDYSGDWDDLNAV